jgi:plasmid stability protein
MARVLLRNVDHVLHERLKASAVTHRRFLEEEACELLRGDETLREIAPSYDVGHSTISRLSA